MEIIPAIDILNGECVRLHQGKYDEVTVFNKNPVEQALQWQHLGAKRIHLVDLDAARDGSSENNSVVNEIANKLTIPVQVGGGVRSIQRADDLLALGVDRVIIGTKAVEEPEIVEKLANKYPKRICVGVDSKNGYVATRGWIEESKVKATNLVEHLSKLDLAAIIATDINTDGTLKGPNIDYLRAICKISKIPIIASGGIGSYSDILSLLNVESYGISGIIVGRALYDKKVDLSEMIKIISNKTLTDISKSKNYFV